MTIGQAIAAATAALSDNALTALGIDQILEDSKQFSSVATKTDGKQKKNIEQLVIDEQAEFAEFERQLEEIKNITGGKRKIEI